MPNEEQKCKHEFFMVDEDTEKCCRCGVDRDIMTTPESPESRRLTMDIEYGRRKFIYESVDRPEDADTIFYFINDAYAKGHAKGLSDGQKKFEAVKKWVAGLPCGIDVSTATLKSKLDEIGGK